MLFSRQQLETANSYMALYYDKVIFVNFVDDTYMPIKVSEEEWVKIPKKTSFTNWVKSFSCSELFRGNRDEFLKLADLKNMSLLDHPYIHQYEKFINNDFHKVQTEVYPTGLGCAYLIVRDLTKINKGEN